MKKNGFTLIEIIIVLFLITLILGLSSVFFAGAFLPAAKMEAAGREIAGQIRQARSLAKLNSVRTLFTIDLDGRTYGIEGQEPKPFPAGTAVRIIDPSSKEISEGKYSLVFSPTGGMSGGTIILSAKKKSLRIELDPITGAAVIKEKK
ncbi:MAG: prepilin-type N-terminal cleavage/methylation domain-containing protein [Deltaproteobacteria bacterium]|nr:prepilin-type N-terminal cleavage/methylation domain-containing protein [Deltaproteobacteria bacterium]